MKGKIKKQQKQKDEKEIVLPNPKSVWLKKENIIKSMEDVIEEIKGKDKPIKAIYIAMTEYQHHLRVITEGE
jgi:hypothetical protein